MTKSVAVKHEVALFTAAPHGPSFRTRKSLCISCPLTQCAAKLAGKLYRTAWAVRSKARHKLSLQKPILRDEVTQRGRLLTGMKHSRAAEIWTRMHPQTFRCLVGSLPATGGDSGAPAPPPLHPRMLRCHGTESPGASGTED